MEFKCNGSQARCLPVSPAEDGETTPGYAARVVTPKSGAEYDGPFTAATKPCRLLRALVARDDLEFEGATHHPALDSGVAEFPQWNVRGYVWPYLRSGQSVHETSTLWFVLKGFDAPYRAVEQTSEIFRRHQLAIWQVLGDEEDDGPLLVLSEYVGEGTYARTPWHPDPFAAGVLASNRELHARVLARTGGVDPNDPEILISTAHCPNPFEWGDW